MYVHEYKYAPLHPTHRWAAGSRSRWGGAYGCSVSASSNRRSLVGVEGGGTPGYGEHRLLCTCNAESKITHQHPAHMHQYYPKRITSTLQPLNLPPSIMQGGLCCCTITGTSRTIHQTVNHEIYKPSCDNQRHKWVHTEWKEAYISIPWMSATPAKIPLRLDLEPPT